MIHFVLSYHSLQSIQNCCLLLFFKSNLTSFTLSSPVLLIVLRTPWLVLRFTPATEEGNRLAIRIRWHGHGAIPSLLRQTGSGKTLPGKLGTAGLGGGSAGKAENGLGTDLRVPFLIDAVSGHDKEVFGCETTRALVL